MGRIGKGRYLSVNERKGEEKRRYNFSREEGDKTEEEKSAL